MNYRYILSLIICLISYQLFSQNDNIELDSTPIATPYLRNIEIAILDTIIHNIDTSLYLLCGKLDSLFLHNKILIKDTLLTVDATAERDEIKHIDAILLTKMAIDLLFIDTVNINTIIYNPFVLKINEVYQFHIDIKYYRKGKPFSLLIGWGLTDCPYYYQFENKAIFLLEKTGKNIELEFVKYLIE